VEHFIAHVYFEVFCVEMFSYMEEGYSSFMCFLFCLYKIRLDILRKGLLYVLYVLYVYSQGSYT
jgi:hypothetical protein